VAHFFEVKERGGGFGRNMYPAALFPGKVILFFYFASSIS
jgi:hypothetical protein